MITAALIAVVAAAGVWLIDRRDTRHAQERDQLLTLLRDERAAMEAARATATPDLGELVALVDRLCQRIQAPAAAVLEHQAATMPLSAPEAIAPDDDEGYWAAQLTKEQLAEQVMEQELAGRGAS